jgi:hypothetical protein
MTGALGISLLKLLGGFVGGYLMASWIESYMHEHVSDAPRRRVQIWQRYPRLLNYLIRTQYSHHAVHHCRTFKQDHVTQFRSSDERDALDALLRERGAHGEIIRRSQYAVKLHGSGSLVFISPLLPVVPLTMALGGWGMTIGACLALALPPFFSNFVHPYLHMRYSEAKLLAPGWLKPLVRSAYFKKIARHHYLHHRYVVCNYNLVLGGDYLRGVYRPASAKDVEQMRLLGLPLD